MQEVQSQNIAKLVSKSSEIYHGCSIASCMDIVIVEPASNYISPINASTNASLLFNCFSKDFLSPKIGMKDPMVIFSLLQAKKCFIYIFPTCDS